jgi:regulator of cell morphogenesis and NO signaling
MQTLNEYILDVTVLEPRQKHPTIFSRFDELEPGESLIIHNDHDPKPLYYQLLGERGHIFTWEYLEQGPDWWKVRITRKQPGEVSETLGQIAASDVRKAEVFRKYSLDFCCGGKKTLHEACQEKGLDVTRIEQELLEAGKNTLARSLSYSDWSLDFLVDYIVNTHHAYVKKTLPELLAYAGKTAKVHGKHHPELLAIQLLVTEINSELLAHLAKEEQVLFPFIKKLVNSGTGDQSDQLSYSGTVQSPINVMEMEHETVAKNFDSIRTLSNNYTLPEDACATYSLLYSKLAEFENDLHTHVHLENNILFPKAINLEKN